MRQGNANFATVAPLTSLLLTVNLALYAVSAVRSGNFGNIDPDVLIGLGGSMRERLWDGDWLRLIMPNFLHGGFMHILMNSMTLYQIGPMAETYFGSANFGTLYLLSGIAGFCFSQMFGGNLSIGASCSLFGVMGAVLAVKILQTPVWRNAWRNSEVRQTAYFLLFYLAIGFVGMLGNVDNWGHLGGLLVGLLIGGFFELWRKNHSMGFAGVLVVVVLVGSLICAARWTIFSPYYHIHMAALAEEEEHAPPEVVQAHFAEARKWAAIWHKEPLVNALIATYQSKIWKLETARENGYRYLPYVIARSQLIAPEPPDTEDETDK